MDIYNNMIIIEHHPEPNIFDYEYHHTELNMNMKTVYGSLKDLRIIQSIENDYYVPPIYGKKYNILYDPINSTIISDVWLVMDIWVGKYKGRIKSISGKIIKYDGDTNSYIAKFSHNNIDNDCMLAEPFTFWIDAFLLKSDIRRNIDVLT